MRPNALSLVVALVVSVGVTAAAQLAEHAPGQGQGPQQGSEPGPVFRLSVSLVQVDAVVTDRKGRHVTTLGPADFQVLQDGKPQPVTAVAYVRADERYLDASGAPEPVVIPTSPRQARRVIALVVDDSRMTFESIYHTRLGLQRFVDRELQADDLVTVVTTSGTRGTSWPFTFSRPELRAAVNRLRFSLWNASAAGALEPLENIFDLLPTTAERDREQHFAVNALNRIADVIAAVRELPGRKTVLLVSEGFSMSGLSDSQIRDAMYGLVDQANRAGVVIYAVDPRGLVFTGLSAADSTGSPSAMAQMMARRHDALLQTQDGLRYVAGQTGGFAVVNNNDMPGAFRRVLEDQRGYYLIGFQPSGDTFYPNRGFRRVKVKVTRRGLRVRTRAGFYGVATE
jgi:VWFA-related protein